MNIKIDIIALTKLKGEIVKTIFKNIEDINDLKQWCIDSRNFIVKNLQKIDSLIQLEFYFSDIDAKFTYTKGLDDSFTINRELLDKENEKLFSIDFIELYKRLKRKPLKDVIKETVESYGKYNKYYNYTIFRILSTFELNSNDWNAWIKNIEVRNNKYYISLYFQDTNTDHDDFIPLNDIYVNCDEVIIISKRYGKKFYFNKDKLYKMLATSIMLNKK